MLQFVGKETMQGREPTELVFVLLGANFRAVGDVKVDDAYVVDRACQNSALRIVEVRKIRNGILGRDLAEYRDTVIGLLATDERVIANRAQCIAGEFISDLFDLLEYEHVGLMVSQPLDNVRLPHIHRVDVPGGNFQVG